MKWCQDEKKKNNNNGIPEGEPTVQKKKFQKQGGTLGKRNHKEKARVEDQEGAECERVAGGR